MEGNKTKTKASAVKSCLWNNRTFHNKRQCLLKSKLRTVLRGDNTFMTVYRDEVELSGTILV